METSLTGITTETYQRQHPLVNPARRVRPENEFVRFDPAQVNQSVPDRFRSQSSLHSGRLAIKSTSGSLTYHELNNASNVIANALLQTTGQASEPVAILLPKDHLVPAAFLGVLISHKFYVPLDVNYPPRRNSQILEDCGAKLVLTSSSHLKMVEEISAKDVRILTIDGLDFDSLAADPELAIPPDELAFVLYTSGSTGTPKGVIHTHRNLLGHVMRLTNCQHISANDRLTGLHSPSFAAAANNIFISLLNGAAFFPFEVTREGLLPMFEWLRGERITLYHSVPSLFRSFARSAANGPGFPDLRLIVLGGEMILTRDIDLYRAVFSDTCLLRVNLGISEANVFSEFYVDKQTEIRPGPVPVGYALEGVDVFTVNEAGVRAEPYEAGEIMIRSDYLSVGYWSRPDLTAAAFHQDPDDIRKRIYRTGDIGYLTPDNCLVCLGRKDSLVKVRGFRVEIAEVEFALLSISALKEAVVLSERDNRGQVRLVAHVAFEEDSHLTTKELREALGELLPDFMIPSEFLVHPELPRNARGKVDRQNLSELGRREEAESAQSNDHASAASLTIPSNTVQAKLTRMWEEALGIAGIGTDQNFFDMGGDSLAAASIAAEIEGEFGVKFIPSMLLEQPTIEHLALRILEGNAAVSSILPLTVTGNRLPFFCIHDIAGDVISLRALAESLGPDQPFYGLRARPDASPESSVQSIASLYIQDIQALYPRGPYMLGGYSFGGLVAFEMAHQLLQRGEEVGFLGLIDTHGPGYPQLRPFLDRLSIHFRTLRRGPAQGRAQFLRERIRINMIRLRKNRLKKPLKHDIHEGRTLPGSLGNLEAIHQRAQRAYAARPYPGMMHLFTARQSDLWQPDRFLGWKGYADGGVEVHDVPGDHVSMLVSPNVDRLAEKLTNFLDPPRVL